MRSAWQAARIMWILHQGNVSRDKVSKGKVSKDQVSTGKVSNLKAPTTVAVKIDDFMCDTDVYPPQGKYQGTIAVVHGMSPSGKNDPRIVTLCQALSQVGFRVLSPGIPSIQALQIDATQIQMLASVLNALATFTPSGRISVLAPSFSGAMCLAAAALPEVKDKIISICAIGAFSDVESVMSFLLADATADPYGRYIVLKKILPVQLKNHQVIQQALDAAIQDNIHNSSNNNASNNNSSINNASVNTSSNSELSKCLAKMSQPQQSSVNQLLSDITYREQMFQTFKFDADSEIEALDIAARLEPLMASVFLLHGQNDKVIPCAQSEILFTKLKQLKKKTELVVTPFLSHGDTHFSFRLIPDLVRIIHGFASFFHDAKRS